MSRSATDPDDGDSKASQSPTWQWIAFVAISLMTTVSGFVWSSTVNRLLDLERELRSKGEQVVRIDTELSNVKKQLDRIEYKVDRLPEK